MKFLVIAVCTFACAYASAVSDAVAAVVRSDIHHSPEGDFHYVYETDNGISASADGKFKTVGKDEIALEVVGSNQYVGPDGQTYETSYVANEFGYQPQKFLVVLAVAVACASADVSHVLGGEADAAVLRSEFANGPEGTFNYVYETANKITAQADGVVKNPNSDNPTLEVRGSYAYVSPDGTPVETTYIANEGGYQPQGSHIPVGPPIPEAIARSLEYIAAHPPPVERKP
ncbi:larval cuticle protein LCP-17-like [Epargyreus clarus]|uniref:larval cuticle protein LCP-17-like n=1 Tax=Epargyreus clarus TaxID=520877 RepID=UPI003C2C75BA